MNGPYFGFQPYEVAKEGREADMYAESFANVDWSRSVSPPLTPGKLLCLRLGTLRSASVKLYNSGWILVQDIIF